VQIYAEGANVNDHKVTRQVCPDQAGGTNHWPATYSRNTKLIYIPSVEGCSDITTDHERHVKGKFDGGGYVNRERSWSSVVALDPTTSEVKFRRELPYPIFGGTLSTAGGLVATGTIDGTLVIMDDQNLEELWKINLGTGFNAPPMTYAVDGKQYIAIASGLFRNARNKLARSTEMRNLSQATMIFVFGL
jgi:alcohol dehydrogenase (cytochrome c)